MSSQFDPHIYIEINRSFYASITRFLFVSVGSSHLLISSFWHWFGFISDSSIIFPNYKSCPNYNITTYPESSVNIVTPAPIGTLIFYVYSGRNVETVHSSEVNDIG